MMSIQDMSYSIKHQLENIFYLSLSDRVTPELKRSISDQADRVFMEAFDGGYLKHRVTTKAETTIFGEGDPAICIPINDSITLRMYNEAGREISVIPFIDIEWCFPFEVAKKRAADGKNLFKGGSNG